MPKSQPKYVTKVYRDGRRIFDERFRAGVVADIAAKRATVAEVMAKFDLSESLIYRWISQAKRAERAQETKRETATTVPPSRNGASDLVAKAANYGRKPGDEGARWRIDDQHVKLAKAYLRGDVSRDQVNYVLRSESGGRGKIITTIWLGAVLKWALASGYRLER